MKNGPYELVIAPKNYPGKRYRGKYCYEHHLVWFNKTGNTPQKGFEIHHKNGNHRDNRFRNLQLLSSSEHKKLHGAIAHSKVKKTAVVCCECGEKFIRTHRRIKSSKNRGSLKSFCTRECQHKSMRCA